MTVSFSTKILIFTFFYIVARKILTFLLVAKPFPIKNIFRSTTAIEKALLTKVCSLSISRHQSLHPSRNTSGANTGRTTGSGTTSVTRSTSKAKPPKAPKANRGVSDTLDAVAKNLSSNVEKTYGRLPSSSTYELPLNTKYDKDLQTPTSSDFSGAQSRTASESSSQRSSIKRTESEPDPNPDPT